MSGAHEERSASTLHRLHNSGAVPREVFRTAPIGRLVTFDFQSTLLQWVEGREDLEEIPRWGVRGGVVPTSFLAQAARAVLRELGAEPSARRGSRAEADALRCLGALVEHLVGSGRVRGWVGLASHVHRSTVPRAPARTPPSTLRMARTLAVYAVFAPPLVLWSRTPSLRWFLPDTLIQLRRFEHVGRTGRRP